MARLTRDKDALGSAVAKWAAEHWGEKASILHTRKMSINHKNLIIHSVKSPLHLDINLENRVAFSGMARCR